MFAKLNEDWKALSDQDKFEFIFNSIKGLNVDPDEEIDITLRLVRGERILINNSYISFSSFLICIEEVAQIYPSILNTIVTPIMSKQPQPLIAISSLHQPKNTFQRMLIEQEPMVHKKDWNTIKDPIVYRKDWITFPMAIKMLLEYIAEQNLINATTQIN